MKKKKLRIVERKQLNSIGNGQYSTRKNQE
jgi:hypothetical protein